MPEVRQMTMPMPPKKASPSSIQTGDIKNNGGSTVVSTGNVTIHQTITASTTTSGSMTFSDVYQRIDAKTKFSKQKKEDLKADVKDVEEAVKKPEVDENFVTRRLRNIGRMAPDILEVALAALANPGAGLGVLAEKIAAKAREK
jgi:hypothetical protein